MMNTIKHMAIFLPSLSGGGVERTTLNLAQGIAGLHKWFSKDFEVYYTNLGKPRRSMTTKFVRGLFKIGRLLTSTPYVSEGAILYKVETEP